jgi:hypothetical protein
MPANFEQIELFALSRQLVVSCYELTMDLDEDEKTNFSRYIRRASLELHINIAQAGFAKPKKRNKLISSVINALVIINTAAGILAEVGLVEVDKVQDLLKLTTECEKLTGEIYLKNNFSDKT